MKGPPGSTINSIAEFISKEFNIEFHLFLFANYVLYGCVGAGQIKALPEKVLKQTPEYNLRVAGRHERLAQIETRIHGGEIFCWLPS